MKLGIHGSVKPIGGVYPKIKAAKKAGAKNVIIPEENMQSILNEIRDIEIIPVSHLNEVFEWAFIKEYPSGHVITASVDLTKKESI